MKDTIKIEELARELLVKTFDSTNSEYACEIVIKKSIKSAVKFYNELEKELEKEISK